MSWYTYNSFRETCEAEGIEKFMWLWNDIKGQYGTRKGEYHSLNHISFMTKFLVKLKKEMGDDWDLSAEDERALFFAVFYHDIVYFPGYPNNEEESAKHMNHLLKICGAKATVTTKAYHLILATKHDAAEAICIQEEEDKAAMLICDADLYKLGHGWKEYEGNMLKVKAEFTQYYESIEWENGRKEFLEGMLARPFIYHIPHNAQKLESRARKNMRRELENYV